MTFVLAQLDQYRPQKLKQFMKEVAPRDHRFQAFAFGEILSAAGHLWSLLASAFAVKLSPTTKSVTRGQAFSGSQKALYLLMCFCLS